MTSSSKESSICSFDDGDSSFTDLPSIDQVSPHNNNVKMLTPISDQSTSSAISDLELLQAMLTSDLDSIKYLISPEKYEQLKKAREEADESDLKLKMSELALDSVHKAADKCHEELRKKVKSITSSSKKHQLKSRRGESVTLLGISKGVLNKSNDNNLSKYEKFELAHKMKEAMKESVADLKKKLEEEKGKLEKNKPFPKMDKDLIRNAEEENILKTEIQTLIENVKKIIIEKQTMLVELGPLRDNNKLQLAELISSSYKNLQDKAQLLSYKTSTLKMECDMKMFKDRFKTLAMNSLGDDLKASIKKLNDKIKHLNTQLETYELKEKSSKSFKNVVHEYGKCKAKLEHFKSTLELVQELGES